MIDGIIGSIQASLEALDVLIKADSDDQTILQQYKLAGSNLRLAIHQLEYAQSVMPAKAVVVKPKAEPVAEPPKGVKAEPELPPVPKREPRLWVPKKLFKQPMP